MKSISKKFIPIFTSLMLGTALSGVTTMTIAQNTNPNLPVSMLSQWDKTFPESPQVEHRKVSFQNR